MIDKALESLMSGGYILDGEPTTEAEFLNSFKIQTGVSGEEAVFSTDPNDFGITWADVTAKRDELVAAEPLKRLREERDIMLMETDWWASSDLTMTQAQIDYRQALRDITNTYTSLDTVVWPTKP